VVRASGLASACPLNRIWLAPDDSAGRQEYGRFRIELDDSSSAVAVTPLRNQYLKESRSK